MIPPPMIVPLLSKFTVINFPKREELLLRRVLAFPKASRMGLAARICCSRFVNPLDAEPADWRVDTSVKN